MCLHFGMQRKFVLISNTNVPAVPVITYHLKEYGFLNKNPIKETNQLHMTKH
jgi:hypothetical protein